jgi:predicted CopG family antitoxin
MLKRINFKKTRDFNDELEKLKTFNKSFSDFLGELIKKHEEKIKKQKCL